MSALSENRSWAALFRVSLSHPSKAQESPLKGCIGLCADGSGSFGCKKLEGSGGTGLKEKDTGSRFDLQGCFHDAHAISSSGVAESDDEGSILAISGSFDSAIRGLWVA